MTTADARMPGRPGRRDTYPGHLGLPLSFVATRMLPIRPGQIAAWEVAIIAAASTFTVFGFAGRFVATLAAVLVVGTTSVRVAGRHFAGWTLTWIGYRLLRHHDRKLATDPLLGLVPDFRLRQHVDRTGNHFGIAGVADGWSAVVRVHGDPDPRTLLHVVRQACDNEDIPLAAAQLTIRVDSSERVHLVAVRFRAAEAPLAAISRGAGELGPLRATARAAVGVVGALADAGCRATVLEAGELAAELRASLGVSSQGGVSDGWSSWSAGDTAQAGFAASADALGTHARNAAFTITSATVSRTRHGKLRDDVVVRAAGLCGRPCPRDFDVPVVPLYGRHESAVRRTLPLALAR